jgi:putative MATE family efflux protein
MALYSLSVTNTAEKPDLTRGSIGRYIFTLGAPAALGMAMQHLYSVVDIFWIGRLGAEAVAAVTLTGSLFFVFFSIAQVIGAGTLAIVARAYGQKDFDRAVHTVRNIIFVGAITGLICGAAGFLFAEPITALLGGRGEVIPLGGAYIRPFSIGSAFQMIAMMIGFSMRGGGDMKTPMLSMFVATAINMVLDPLLIFGLGPFPEWGIAGAGIATMISQMLSALYLFVVLVSGRSLLHVPIVTRFRPCWPTIWEALRIGIPAGLQYLALTFSFMILLRIVAISFGTEPISAAGIAWRLMHLAIVPVIGIGISVSTLVGQNLGADKPRRAVRANRIGVLWSVLCVGALGSLFAAFPELFMGIFIESQQVIELGRDFLRILLVNNILLGVIFTFNSTFSGAGDNVPSMIGAVVRGSLLISLSWLLSTHTNLGLNAIWLCFPVASCVNLVVMIGFYRRGMWKTQMVRNERSRKNPV